MAEQDVTRKKTAIVFGGAGFIGTHLLRALAANGNYERIVCADRLIPAFTGAGIEYVLCDVRQPIALEGRFERPEVYNLAAVHTTPGHEDWEYFWTNVSGAVHVCDFAARINCETIVFTSSISTYGPSESPLDENGPFQPDSAYGCSKLQAEKIHRLWREGSASRKLVIVRPAVIFGAGEGGNFTRLAKLLKSGRFFYPGRKDTIKACGYVGELVRSIEFVRDLRRDEVTYNFAYPQRYTIEDICETISEVAGYARPAITIPLEPMLIGGRAFELLARLGIKTSVNRARVLKLVNSTNIVPAKLKELNYVFETNLKDGLSEWKSESKGQFV